VAENPIDLMFDAVYAHYGLPWQFWKNDIANTDDLALAVKALRPLGYKGMAITVPWKVAVIPLLDGVDGDVEAIGAANYMTIENGRLIGHNNDGKGVVKAIEKVAPLKGQRVVMLGAGGAGRAMAVELAWAGAAHLTLITRREEQGREVAATVTRASGVPADWQPWSGEVAVPAGTTLLMNATHLGCAPEQEEVPLAWDTLDPACVVVDVITNPPHHALPSHGPPARLPGGGWGGDAGAVGDADLPSVDRHHPGGGRVPAGGGGGARGNAGGVMPSNQSIARILFLSRRDQP